jgi:hypothetical protein
MPTDNPEESLAAFLRAEEVLRVGTADIAHALTIEQRLDGYWADLVRLLRAYRHYRDKNVEAILELATHMASPIYEPFLKQKASNVVNRATP